MVRRMTRKAEMEALLGWTQGCTRPHARSFYIKKAIPRLNIRSAKQLWDKWDNGAVLAGNVNKLVEGTELNTHILISTRIRSIVSLLPKNHIDHREFCIRNGILPYGYFCPESKDALKAYADLIRKHIPWPVIRQALVDEGVF